MAPPRPVRARPLFPSALPRCAGGGEGTGPRRAAPPDPSPGGVRWLTVTHRRFPPPFKMAAAEPAPLVTCPQGGFPAVPPGEGRRTLLHNGRVSAVLRPRSGAWARSRARPAAPGCCEPGAPPPGASPRPAGRWCEELPLPGTLGTPLPFSRRESRAGGGPRAWEGPGISAGKLCRKQGLSREGLWCARFTER